MSTDKDTKRVKQKPGPKSSGSTFQTWWEKNGEMVNRERAEKRANDPDYKAKVALWNKNARNNKRIRAGEDPTIRRNHQSYRLILIDGVVYFTIGAVAKCVGCSRQAVRQWEEAGSIPKPALMPDDTSHHQRFYTWEQVLKIKKLMGGKVAAHTEEDLVIVRQVELANKRQTAWPFVRIGFVATMADRAVSTMLKYEQEGLIPETPFVGGKAVKNRYYSLEMAEAICAALRPYDTNKQLRRPPDAALAEKIRVAWVALGVFSYDGKTLASFVS